MKARCAARMDESRGLSMLAVAVLVAALACAGPAAAQSQGAAPAKGPAGPLAEMVPLLGTWRAAGPGFESELAYRWLLEGHVLAVDNDVRDADGEPIARYRGAYAWDAGRGGIVFWTAAAGGEIHRGRAWWKDGVLWHEAEVSGGHIEAYASAVRPGDSRLEFFADYGTREAGPELLASDPLVYAPVESESEESR